MASPLISEMMGSMGVTKTVQPRSEKRTGIGETVETAEDTPPLSPFVFLNGAGLSLPAPLEWQTGFIELNIALHLWESSRFWRNGEEIPISLQRLAGKTRVLAPWPLSGPGRYELRLLSGGEAAEQTITVLPRKITQGAFADLLRHLEERLPASIALGLQRCGGLAGIEIVPPRDTTQNEELLRLRLAVRGNASQPGQPGLTHLLPLIARDPHHVLQATEPWVRRDQARRPHPTRLVHALTRGDNLGTDGLPERLFDVRVEHTVDVYENRLLLAFAIEVNLRLRRLRDISGGISGGGTNAPIRSECEALLQELTLARRLAPFLDQVTVPQFLPMRPTMVLLKRPPYHAALQAYLRLHRSVAIRLEEPALQAPLENLPSLYQTWGTLEVIDALLSVAAEAGFRVSKSELVQRDPTGFFVRVLPDGRPALVLIHPETQVVVRLTPERSFRRRHKPEDIHSISFEQRPDVTVEVEIPGDPPQLYLFDPKYKLDGESAVAPSGEAVPGVNAAASEGAAVSGRPKKLDIDKMHAYRDAIRGEDGERVVQYAAILYPGPEEQFGDGIEALSALPNNPEQLQQSLRRILLKAILKVVDT